MALKAKFFNPVTLVIVAVVVVALVIAVKSLGSPNMAALPPNEISTGAVGGESSGYDYASVPVNEPAPSVSQEETDHFASSVNDVLPADSDGSMIANGQDAQDARNRVI